MFDDADSIGLAAVLQALREEIAIAQEEAHMSGLTFSISGVTVEMKVGVTRRVDGRAGFRIPLSAELGARGGWKSESLQTVTLSLDTPTTEDGVPVRVGSATNAEKG